MNIIDLETQSPPAASTNSFGLSTDGDGALELTLPQDLGFGTEPVPIRIEIVGERLYRVWKWLDSGEDVPEWSDPDLQLTLFDAGVDLTAASSDSGAEWQAVTRTERAAAVLKATLDDATGEIALHVELSNPQPEGGLDLPVCELLVRIGSLPRNLEFLTAHSYGGRTYDRGKLDEVEPEGVGFSYGCTGLALPLLYLFDPSDSKGMQFEFMVGGHPQVRLIPSASDQADFCLVLPLARRLAPGECHVMEGVLRLKSFSGDPVARMRDWRDAAAGRYGLQSPPTPGWARRMNIIQFDTCPRRRHHPFTRLDDPRVRTLLASWKAMGYTAIFTVGHNHTGQNYLSPFDYVPCAEVGGAEGERQYLEWARELGFRVFLWVTTVGMDRDAPEVRTHPDWWTRRRNGEPFYAWESNAANGYVGYAPDADPLSRGWRDWLKDQVTSIIGRGYDGIYVDGLIPRADNHARPDWPGEGRNGVAAQVAELASHVRDLGKDLILFVEDEGLSAQASCEVTQGRYEAEPPRYKQGFIEVMTGAGKTELDRMPCVAPEDTRDYLRLRLASLLPGVVSNDMLEGFSGGAACRPWVVQSLVSGMVPKTHSFHVDYDVWKKTPEAATDFENFFELLRLCRDEPVLLREAPVSLDAVQVEGDAAVVGFVRPTPDRCLLALVQFAGRPASVRVRLRQPTDVTPDCLASDMELAIPWQLRERLRSAADTEPYPEVFLKAGASLSCELGPYGYRIFELTAYSDQRAKQNG